MVKSPAHWERPGSDRGTPVDQGKDLKVGKPSLGIRPNQDDIHAVAKKAGIGFSGNAVEVHRYSTNPAAGEYRDPPEHRYKLTDTGAGTGPARVEIQNRLASKRK